MGSARRRATRWLVVPFVAAVTASVAIALAPSPATAQSTLRTAAGSSMFVGAAVTPGLLNQSQYGNIARTEFSSLTAENDMKWETLQPSQGNFNWGAADQIVNFARQNNQHVYGHTLVWHSQTPNWVHNLSGTQMQSAMQTHINAVMGRYRGDVRTWDVVNEVISDNGGQMRDSFWLRGMGEGFIAQAFRYARAADPNAVLCMNDYSIDGINVKSDAYYNLAQRLLSQGVPIDCMGFQAHLIVNQVPGNMQQNIQRFKNLGLEVWVTELDIRMPTPASQSNLQQQARDYGQVFTICRNVGCRGLTVWGIHDAQSWVPGHFPGEGAALMWNDNFTKKPAYDAALQALGGGGGPTTAPPTTAPPTTAPPTTTPPTTAPPTTPPGGSAACSVSYSAANWGGAPGFTASVTIRNTGNSAINGWQLRFNFTGGQTVSDGWSATWSQSGNTVTAQNLGWNGTLGPNQSTQIGFNGTMTSANNNPAPTSFTLNGSACTSA